MHVTVAEREEQLDHALADYLKAVDAGTSPEPSQWLACYPELAAELTEFFSGQQEFQCWTEPLRVLSRDGKPPGALVDDTPKASEDSSPTYTSHLPTALPDYELLEELGRGGMGVVYRARQQSLHRLVAVKLIRADRLPTAADVQRFRNEAETAAQLDHPHIVPIYEVGEREGQPYFSMKLIEGRNLAQLLDRFQAEPRAAAELLATIARAVHHAHQRGVLHRDLKPSNILTDQNGHPYLTDFGLAKLLAKNQDLTHTGDLVGTPSYMAPEQASDRNGVVTTATDVYGLGVILYAMLTGEPPFKGFDVLDTLAQVREQEPISPRQRNAKVDRNLETICLKSLAKDPAGRYSSAQALADDLDAYLADRHIRARRPTVWQRVRKLGRRHKAILRTAVAVLIAAALVGAGLLWNERGRTLDALEQAKNHAADAVEQKNLALDRAKVLRRRVYVGDMHRAFELWHLGLMDELAGVLDQYEPAPDQEDLRGFEWHLLRSVVEASPRMILDCKGHEGDVGGLYSPDGQTLVSGGRDETIRFWDPITGACRAEIPRAHSEFINSGSFSPDGKVLVTVGNDDSIRFWDAITYQPCGLIRNPSPIVESAVFSPDGTKLATGGRDKLVRLWDFTSHTLEAELAGHQVGIDPWRRGIEQLAFSPDGRTLASAANDGWVIVWDVAGRKELRKLPHNVPVKTVAFSPDGTLLATGSDHLHLWDAASGKHLRQRGPYLHSVRRVAFSRDGTKLGTIGDDGQLRLWSVPDFQLLTAPNVHGNWTLDFSPDGRSVVVGGRSGNLQVWDVQAAKQPVPVPFSRTAGLRAAFSPDGQTLATWRPGALELWSTAACARFRVFDTPHYHGPANLFAFLPDGHTLAYAHFDLSVRLWNLHRGEERLLIPARSGGIYSLAVLSDGRVMVSHPSGDLCCWHPGTAEVRTLRPLIPDFTFPELAPYPNGKTLALSSYGRTWFWDLQREKLLSDEPIQFSAVLDAAFSPDGTPSHIDLGRSSEMGACRGFFAGWADAGQRQLGRNCPLVERGDGAGAIHPGVSPRPLAPCRGFLARRHHPGRGGRTSRGRRTRGHTLACARLLRLTAGP
jgi:WD40 repeat protein/tRNA A-37 threonylcarbamoyl transferase component Bud32